MMQEGHFWQQDRQPVETGQSCQRERTACASPASLEVHARGSQAHHFFFRQATEVLISLTPVYAKYVFKHTALIDDLFSSSQAGG